MNLLQAAAKIHEVIMVFSLSAIIVAIYRRQLIGNGVRLAFLTAGYRVGDLGYLLSSPLWRQALDKARPVEILLFGLFVFATLMSATVGPSSAVLLTPSLDWFEFAPGTAFSNLTSPLIYRRNRDDVWNSVMQVKEDSWEAEWCGTSQALYDTDCPASGFREINQWVRQWKATNLDSPIMFQSVASDIGRRLKPLTGEKSVVLTTTPSNFLLNSIGLLQNYIATANVGAVSGDLGSRRPRYRLHTPSSSELLQPFVQSECKVYKKPDFMKLTEVDYPTQGLNCMGNRECETRRAAPRKFVPATSKFNNASYSDVTDLFLDIPISTVVYLSGQTSKQQGVRDEDNVYLCSAVASWIPANYTFDPIKTNVLESSLQENKTMLGVGDNESSTGIMVSFTISWLRLLNPWIDPRKDNEWSVLAALTSNFETFTDIPDQLSAVEQKEKKTARNILLATAIGGYLTEALARTCTTGMTVVNLSRDDTTLSYAKLDWQRQSFVSTISAHNSTHVSNNATGKTYRKDLEQLERDFLNKSLPIELTAERYGYGTGQPRKTLQFAQVMLAMYLGAVSLYAAAIAVGHVLDILRDDANLARHDNLLFLTLKTLAPTSGDLVDAGAGVTSSGIWKKIARVRADYRDHVQLVMDYEAQETTRPLGVTGKENYY
ncbi:hypothetical protein PG985_005339 [Apiospora marii]|uniref:Uncharacterized protein n=1 Tax=Apiospora marii TaxID=335849 RepID=A0ABR1SD92_9PEZI